MPKQRLIYLSIYHCMNCRRIEGEAEDMDEFIEDMKYEIEEAVQFYIEADDG